MDFLKKLFNTYVELNTPHISSIEARELIFRVLWPILKQKGFSEHKGNCIWRINDIKIDTIELRFLTISERKQFKLPASSFSVLYGCYFTFFPKLWEKRLIYQIENILTPREVHCHFRSKAKRTLMQMPKNMDYSLWHLDESEEKQNLVLNDVSSQIVNAVLPTLDSFNDVNNWLKLLNSDTYSLGIGNIKSLERKYLLGFTYKYLGDACKAKEFLMDAKIIAESIDKKIAKHMKDLPSNAPVFIKQQNIDSALDELSNP